MSHLPALLEKAQRLPLTPGVYLMKDADDKIIYVGKSKALRNRLCSYFQPHADLNRKTALMVSHVRSFDVMHTDTEMEALTLENRLIKLHTPKYNIRLKDAKSYPYLKVTVDQPYPRIEVVRRRLADKAAYFGPYSGISTAYDIARTARKCFGIPSCRRQFPRDIGKDRPCLNLQLGLCPGICTGNVTEVQYRESIEELMRFLKGDIRGVMTDLRARMEFAAEHLMFEAAAACRDRLRALEKLKEKQKVVASPDTEQDAFALYEGEDVSVLTVFYVRGGCITDCESFRFPASQSPNSSDLACFLLDLYTRRANIPPTILTDFELEEEDREGLCQWLRGRAGRKVSLIHPLRGDKRAFCEMVAENAAQQAQRYRDAQEKDDRSLVRLASLLRLEVIPERIEAWDVSNLGNEHITAGKVSLCGTKFDKSAYRVYAIRDRDCVDDYASMRQAVDRRLSHAEDDPYPDLILLDGGRGHVGVIRALLAERGVDIPVFGMVKDDHHKTRALVGEDEEISIATEQEVFLLIYRLQEEVHRFTVSRMTAAKRKTVKTSSLEQIEGIGPAKAKALLMHFPTLTDLKSASVEQIRAVKGIGDADARRVYAHFHPSSPSDERKDTI